MVPNHTAYSKLYPRSFNKRRGQESNLCSPGSEPGATTNSCRLGVKRSSALRPGIAPDLRASKAHAATTRRRECPAGVEPASPVWKTGTFAARSRARDVKRKERESNPQGREARPGSSGVPSPVGLPFRSLKAPVGGIEPPIIGLTGRRLTVWPHRIMSVRTAGIEPAFSCSQGTRDARLPHVLILRAPSGSRTHTSAMARQ